MNVRVYSRTEGKYIIIDVTGDFGIGDIRNSVVVGEELSRQLRRDDYNIALNLEKAHTLDSSLVGIISSAAKKLESSGRHMAIINPRNSSCDILSMVGITKGYNGVIKRYESMAVFRRYTQET